MPELAALRRNQLKKNAQRGQMSAYEVINGRRVYEMGGSYKCEK